MYHSRLHVTNGLVSAALDALTGEPLELVLEENRTPHSWKNPVWRHKDGSIAEW